MSHNHIHISHLVTDLSAQRTYYACIMKDLALNGDLTTSDICSINRCRMSKGFFFISTICNHQGTHLQKSSADYDKIFNIIHDFNCTRRHHTTISAWRMWRKSLRNPCDESKFNLSSSLGQWRLDTKEDIISWQWLLSRDLHTVHYTEHKTWCKYTRPLNCARACRRIAFQTDTNSV